MSEKARSKIGGLSRLNDLQPHPSARARLLLPSAGPFRALPEDSDAADPRNGLLEQFQTFAEELQAVARAKPVTFPSGRARLVTSPIGNRIANASEDNGDSPWSLAWRPALGGRLRPR